MAEDIPYRLDPLTPEERDFVNAALPSYYGGNREPMSNQIEKLLQERTSSEAWGRYQQQAQTEKQNFLWRFAEQLPGWQELIRGSGAPSPEEAPGDWGEANPPRG